ncbi:MAG: cysteine desulfurase [Thermodesulfovibrionales bacterium]|nr:cysteine desulfurase [Thermodesulfovibrionales bacterium]
MNNEPIYLDYNATTPIAPQVKQEIVRCLDIFGNPSSSHRYGILARQIVDNARLQVSKLLGCNPDEIIFTSGGTESNNLAIVGYMLRFNKGHIISSLIEHPSVLNPLMLLKEEGYEVTFVPIGSDGIIDPDDIKRAIRSDTRLITVMHANNETGAIQHITEIGKIAKEHGIVFHSDGAQCLGKISTRVYDLNVDLYTIAGHKFYAPKGVGALFIRDGVEIQPVLRGAGQEKGIRPGTENVPYISGLGKACELVFDGITSFAEHSLMLTRTLYEMLLSCFPVKLNGSFTQRLPNTLNISIRGIKAHDLVATLSDSVAISAGSACHSGIPKPSLTLQSMGLTDDALSAIRVSTGIYTTIDDINEACKRLIKAVNKLKL